MISQSLFINSNFTFILIHIKNGIYDCINILLR